MEEHETLDLFGEGIDPRDRAPEPAEEPVPGQPAAEPAEEPVPEEPAEEPVPGQPAAEPAEEPVPGQPAAEPAEEPADEPIEEPVVEPAEEPADPILPELESLKAATAEISARLEELEKLFDRRILYTDKDREVIDRMHAELQKYKEDLYLQILRPFLIDVAQVRDSIMRTAATFAARPEGERNIPNKTFFNYSYDMQEILEKNGVEIYGSKPGDVYVPARQRAVKKVVTDDETKHGTVAESLSDGYMLCGKVLSPEKVAVCVYEQPKAE